ncbi:hypothetical protein F4827_001630 [Paraburkholderia bannensis]|uniref:Uncharacterized protein n=1 Tax=Paraburkholderia bannensis TaxID=765414 RepID=A0A7W9TUW5_9BURK|nr:MULTISPECIES: hypothetical protein [Paraburkholderia]MBB3256783.1 hypothetical protein [Paraburkholderia sp. WP4_3_2]MBB6101782.1 hypothetical protein [Paraburkholderia bannensis]
MSDARRRMRREAESATGITGRTQQQAVRDCWLALAAIHAASNSGIEP